MKGLEKNQITEAIAKFFDNHRELLEEFEGYLPKPDTESAEKQIQALAGKIRRAFPHTRWGNNLDNFAYKRVSPAITIFKAAVLDYGRRYTAAKQWESLISYCEKLIPLVDDLPAWNDPSQRKPQA